MKFLKMLPVVALSLSMILFTSCGKNASGETSLQIPGVDGPKLQLVGDQMLISIVFENIAIDGGLRYPIPKYPNSHIEIAPDFESAGTLMVVAVDLDDIFKGSLQQLDAQSLPGGRALPGVASGRLPAVAFSIPKWKNMAFYLGPQLFGIFVPIKLNMQGAMITARFYVDGKRQGNISLVGEDAKGENGGFLLMLDMNATTQKALRSVATKY